MYHVEVTIIAVFVTVCHSDGQGQDPLAFIDRNGRPFKICHFMHDRY